MRWSVEVRGGEVPVLADDDTGETIVILAPGAGSHMEHNTLEWLSGLVRDTSPDPSPSAPSPPEGGGGACVVRFNFLYRAQGRSMPDRMPVLMETYRAVIASVRDRLAPKRLVIGGHSMGGRVASMLEAENASAEGLLVFGYPLHPPGQPEKLRDGHLGAIQTPTLQLNGTADELCTKAVMDQVATTLDPRVWRLEWIEGADHSYAVKKSSGRTKQDVESDIRSAVRDWLERVP